MFRTLSLLIVAVGIAGCATYGQDRHFEPNADAQAASRNFKAPPEQATVFFFRERAWLQSIMYQPIPPAYFAVNERLVSVMPVGSYLTLSLPPGRHKFTRVVATGDWLTPLQINRHDASLEVEAGKTYYVGSVNTFGPDPVRLVDSATGKQTVDEAQLARQIHNPVTVTEFIARLRRSDGESKTGSAARSGSWQSTTTTAALPSSSQVSSFLEVLATAAMVAVLLLGAATAATPPPSAPTVSSPAAIYQQASPSPQAQASWRPATASISDILWSGGRAEFRDLNTGVRYTIEDGRIRGSDGSRFRAYGSQVVSDTGQWYQVVGSTFYSQDGRTCTRSGSTIGCR